MSLGAPAGRSWPGGHLGAVTLTFDGGYARTVDLVTPLLLERGYPATWFLVTGSVGQLLEGRPVAGWRCWSEMADRGMEIASHTVSHPQLRWPFPRSAWVRAKHLAERALVRLGARAPRASSPEEARLVDDLTMHDEAVTAARDIRRRLPSVDVTAFAYTNGRHTRRLRTMLEASGFRSARTTDDGLNAPPLDLFRLRSKVVTRDTPPEQVRQWLQQTVRQGAWLILTYHLVTGNGDEGYYWEIPALQFRQHLADLRQHPLWVATQTDVTHHLQGPPVLRS